MLVNQKQFSVSLDKAKTFSHFSKNMDITIVANEDGTVDDLIKKIFTFGWSGTRTMTLCDGSTYSPNTFHWDIGELKNAPGEYKIYGVGNWGDKMSVRTPDERPYYTVRILPYGSFNGEANYMQNHYPDTYSTMTEVPEEVLNMDFAHAISMKGFFSGCAALKEVPHLKNTHRVADFSNMFSGCQSLKTASGIDMTGGTNFSSMFLDCTSLESVDLNFAHPNMDYTKVTNGVVSFGNMFKNCSSLKSISPIDAYGIKTVDNMFAGCTALEKVEVYNCDTNSVTKAKLDSAGTTTFALSVSLRP